MDEDIISSDFIGRLDALQGHDVSALGEALKAIEIALTNTIKAKAQQIMTEGVAAEILLLGKNYCTLSEYVETLMPKQLAKNVFEKSVPFANAYIKYREVKNKTNTTAFCKAAVGWQDVRLPLAAQTPEHQGFLAAFLLGLQDALMEHKKLRKDMAEEGAEILRELVKTYSLIAAGSRDGSSWRSGLSDDAALKVVLDHTMVPKTGLLAGPGTKVMAGKQTLTEVFIKQTPPSILLQNGRPCVVVLRVLLVECPPLLSEALSCRWGHP